MLAEPESRPGPIARPGPRPGPAVRKAHPVTKNPFTGPPKPYAFRYGVADVKTGSNYDHAQQQEASGVVRGNVDRDLVTNPTAWVQNPNSFL